MAADNIAGARRYTTNRNAPYVIDSNTVRVSNWIGTRQHSAAVSADIVTLNRKCSVGIVTFSPDVQRIARDDVTGTYTSVRRTVVIIISSDDRPYSDPVNSSTIGTVAKDCRTVSPQPDHIASNPSSVAIAKHYST